jgi:hypothetical protein
MLFMYLLSDYEMVPVAPGITGITFVLSFIFIHSSSLSYDRLINVPLLAEEMLQIALVQWVKGGNSAAGATSDRLEFWPKELNFTLKQQYDWLWAHPASYTMGTGSFPGVKRGLGVTLTPYPLLVSLVMKSRAIPLLLLWAVRLVQCFIACTRVIFTFINQYKKCSNANLVTNRGQRTGERKWKKGK